MSSPAGGEELNVAAAGHAAGRSPSTSPCPAVAPRVAFIGHPALGKVCKLPVAMELRRTADGAGGRCSIQNTRRPGQFESAHTPQTNLGKVRPSRRITTRRQHAGNELRQEPMRPSRGTSRVQPYLPCYQSASRKLNRAAGASGAQPHRTGGDTPPWRQADSYYRPPGLRTTRRIAGKTQTQVSGPPSPAKVLFQGRPEKYPRPWEPSGKGINWPATTCWCLPNPYQGIFDSKGVLSVAMPSPTRFNLRHLSRHAGRGPARGTGEARHANRRCQL